MAETEELIELGWKLGFFGPVSNAVFTHSFQIVTDMCARWNLSITTLILCGRTIILAFALIFTNM